MRLTSRGDYAVRTLIELAKIEGTVLSLHAAASNQHIPFYYLQNLIGLLKKAGLVSSQRGKGGGYFLAKPADKITLYEIFAAVQEPVNSILQDYKKGDTVEANNLYGVFSTIDRVADNILNEVTLKDLI